MSNLKEVRIRIASVTSTQQITSAMKLVSASKLKRAQDAILKLRPYSAKLDELLESLVVSLGNDVQEEIVFAKQRPVKKVLFVVITSNRGLCGAFNANVIKRTLALIEENYSQQAAAGNVHILSIGRKSSEFFAKKHFKMLDTHNELFDKLAYGNVAPVAEMVMDYFVSNVYDRVEIVYNQFKNAAVQILTNEQFLPVKMVDIKEVKDKDRNADYIFEPDKTIVLQEIIPKILKVKFYKALLDSYAAEHGARMTSMHKATDNATELLNVLKQSYNKARQAAITNEILEIVGGAEALKS
ncbi:MAG: ATP synthase F1 subunit gamma [Bacteroidota bacterium]|nr:ATP synthase F1 subunit gamma [Bacteroidota bacterium]